MSTLGCSRKPTLSSAGSRNLNSSAFSGSSSMPQSLELAQHGVPARLGLTALAVGSQ
jgi:hypothetical protein